MARHHCTGPAVRAMKVVEMLLKLGVDAKAKTNVSTVPPSPRSPPSPCTMIHLSHMMMVWRCMDLQDGTTTLHKACSSGRVEVVEMLLKLGVDIEAKDTNGTTPLHSACRFGRAEVVKKLLKCGADVKVKDTNGKTPLDVVPSYGDNIRPVLDAFAIPLAWLPPLPSPAPTLEKITATALDALDQALRVPEALNNRLSQLDSSSDNLEAVLQELHALTAKFKLKKILHKLQTALTACPAPPTAPASSPNAPPTNLAAALDKVIALSKVGPELQELLTSSNNSLKCLILSFIDALDAVAKAGTSDTIHRVDTLRNLARCQDVSEAPPPKVLPEAWEQLVQAHNELSLSKLNGLMQVAQWQAPPDYEHQGWYLTFVLHESQALVKQLQDMITWQETTLSALKSCMSLASNLVQGHVDEDGASHEELDKLHEQIKAADKFLSVAPQDMRSGLEQNLAELKKRHAALQEQLSGQSRVDHVIELTELLHQHFPTLLVFLNPRQSSLGARLCTVLGPDLPATLILEAMTEVDQGLALSSLGRLEVHYVQNHKVYKARAALPRCPEQDLAVKEYVFVQQRKQDQCRTFLRELRAMRRLEHPHIVPVLHALVEVNSGHPSAFLVQPWCAQGDLQQWLSRARQQATSNIVAGIMAQLRAALAFMHSRGLVHRDVKLSNVMLDGEEDQPVVRLGDFDIAKAAVEATMLPCTATASVGTSGYVAPEVLFGRGRVGARPTQDAFSFGCVLYNTYMFPQTVPPAHPQLKDVIQQCQWNSKADATMLNFPHLAAEMCDATSDLYKETRSFLSTDPKMRPSLLSAAQFTQQPTTVAHIAPAVEILRDAPELVPEVTELLQQLNADGRGPKNMIVQRVERVQNAVLWERYSRKRREMVQHTKDHEHFARLCTATVDALPGQPALLQEALCQERLLFHGIAYDDSQRDKIVRLGLDYRFAGNGAGTRFGLGVYHADHPGKSHQYATPGPNGERMLIVTRALLGQAFVHQAPSSGALAPPLLPEAPNNERYDSVIATPAGQFHEVVVFDNDQIYPELVVYYTAD
ncbi:uncharacterized protein MONBRDRAFT_12449 [Monosiga brevicollis MX1]|uniref:Poly [ADP-ribose] polymerase n=1 Tax=Monosiga brevicollis TaxID=81824 RepID=A9VCB1_MONBE|nr:uncharacterized protein MONBRDRAFT_12449 [Monosiga brevicollis MX1]EDQ84869.1 predicted protein [Monosiga brevicollis MX1]|eukprot:XP_001750370.1 hypothetical protein [Monosiga brevicollis MX1]